MSAVYDPAAPVQMIEVHGWADPDAGTGDALIGYLAAEPINRGIDAAKRWADPVPLDQAGSWDRAEAAELAGAFNRVHKWGQKRRRRWAVTVPAGLNADADELRRCDRCAAICDSRISVCECGSDCPYPPVVR